MNKVMNLFGGDQKFGNQDLKQAENIWKMLDDMAESNPEVGSDPANTRNTRSSSAARCRKAGK